MSVRHQPQSFAQSARDAVDVDRLVVVVAERELQQQHDRVDQVLLVDLHDLHLLEQQLGERDRLGIELESILPQDRVTELELVEEHVDVHPDPRVLRDEARALGSDVDVRIVHVPGAGQHLADPIRLAPVGGEVDVGVVAAEPFPQLGMIRAAPGERDRAEQPKGDPRVPGETQQAIGLRLELRLLQGDLPKRSSLPARRIRVWALRSRDATGGVPRVNRARPGTRRGPARRGSWAPPSLRTPRRS